VNLGEPRLYFSLLQDHSWLAYEDGRHEGLNLDEPGSGWAPVFSLDQDQSWLWHTVKGRREGLKLYEPGPGCSAEIWRSSLVDCYTEANSTAPPNVNVDTSSTVSDIYVRQLVTIVSCWSGKCEVMQLHFQRGPQPWGQGRYWLSTSRQYTQFTIQAKSVTEDVIFQGKRNKCGLKGE